MKNQFQSTEALQIRQPAFVNKTTGEYMVTGAETITLEIRRPDGSALPGGPHVAIWDTNVHIWYFNVLVGSYVQGEWRVKATSSDANALPRWWFGQWGDYVEDITAAKTSANAVNTKLGTPAGASVSADIASAASSAVAAAASSATAAADTAVIRKLQANRWKVQGTQLLVYENDGSTIFKTFNLKDDSGDASGTRIFERVPV